MLLVDWWPIHCIVVKYIDSVNQMKLIKRLKVDGFGVKIKLLPNK